MKKKTLAILNATGLVATIWVNYLSNTGMINGNTMRTVSDRYHNLFTPAPYAFSIWGLIYLLLIGFVIYSFVIIKKQKESHVLEQVGVWFLITCLANCIWIFAWLNNFIGVSVILMIVLLIALIKIIINTMAELTNPPFRIVVFVWWPFTIYAGWISVALIADIAALLTKIQWTGFGISEISWTILMIVIAGLLYVFMTWKRNMREYALVGSWALVAVAFANKGNHPFIFWVALITATIIALSSIIHGIKNFRGFGKNYEVYELEKA